MPRGRAGLSLIAPDEVTETIRRHFKSDTYVARQFGVCERTVRRWKATGLALYYGKANITREAWEQFKGTGQVPRSASLSAELEPTNKNDSHSRRIRSKVSTRSTPGARTGFGRSPAKRRKPVRAAARAPVDRHLSAPSRGHKRTTRSRNVTQS